MSPCFEEDYRSWLDRHIALSQGERRRRIRHRHGFGEKLFLEHVWWPAVGHLDDLHPEYEFVDAEGNYGYMDYGYIRLPRPACIEIDGFGSHARDVDRNSFSRNLDRQNEIVLGNWNILRFSIDKLKENPFACQKHIRRMLDQWYGEDKSSLLALPLYQREIIRLASRSAAPITVAMACECLGKQKTFVYGQLDALVEKGWLVPATGSKRVRSYKLADSTSDFMPPA